MIEMRDAFPGFGVGPLLGLGQVSRSRDEDLTATGVAGLPPRVMIGLDLLGEVRPGRVADGGENRNALPANRRESIRRAGSYADRRVGF